jgi:hypothetical protein
MIESILDFGNLDPTTTKQQIAVFVSQSVPL